MAVRQLGPLGPRGAHDWLIEAAASGATRVRAKVAGAVELATIVGAAEVDQAFHRVVLSSA
jgi:hypothetical protein